MMDARPTRDDLPIAIDAFRVPLEYATDVGGLRELVRDGRLRADDVIAVTGKTEGNTPGETSRIDAYQAVRTFLAEHGTRSPQELDQVPMAFTAGNPGLLTPHLVIYTRTHAEPVADGSPRLSIGVARSAPMLPEWTGTEQTVRANADAVREAADQAGLDPAEIEYVVGKAYYPTSHDLAAARTAGQPIPEFDEGTLFRRGSGSAGLGVAMVADGMPLPDAADVGERTDLWTAKAAVSANPREGVGGAEPRTQLMVLGNRPGVGGRLRVGHSAVNDLLDLDALPRALRRAGLDVAGPLTPEQSARVVAVYVKFSLPPDGRLRGRRQVVENPAYGGEIKAALAGMFCGYLQDNLLWISASATHQGPPGGGTLAVVVDVS